MMTNKTSERLNRWFDELNTLQKIYREREVIAYVKSTLADVRRKEQRAARRQQLDNDQFVMQYITAKK
jgi:hypothetical protein